MTKKVSTKQNIDLIMSYNLYLWNIFYVMKYKENNIQFCALWYM
jgi:hypothetical protein